MTKYSKLIAVTSFIFLICLVVFYQLVPLQQNTLASKVPTNIKAINKAATNRFDSSNPVHYSSTMKMGVNSINEKNKQTPLMEMQISFDFALSKQTNPNGRYNGIIYNVTSKKMNADMLKERGIPAVLGFEFNYDDGVFSSVDLLGLSDNHPMTMIKIILPQMTISNSRQTLDLGFSKHTYDYSNNGTMVHRELLSFKPSVNMPYKIADLKEDWQMLIAPDNYPKTMFLVEEKTSIADNLKHLSIVNVHVTRKETNTLDDWNSELFAKNINDQYNVEIAPTLPVIDSQKLLMQSLASFNTNGSKNLAIAMGNYIISDLGSTFVFDTILDPKFDDQQKSVLIYALQEANIEGGENILNALSLSEEVDEHNRLRAIISSAYRADRATESSLAMMQTLLNHDNPNIANTALLNIGSLGKFSPKLQQQVNTLIEEQLEQFDDKYIVMRTVENLGSNEHNDEFTQYLTSNMNGLKKASASLLAKSEKHRDLVINQMFKETSVIGTKAMVQAIIKSGNTTFSGTEQSELNHTIVQSIKDDDGRFQQLLKFYFHDDANLSNQDIAFLRSLNMDYDLPQSFKEQIERI